MRFGWDEAKNQRNLLKHHVLKHHVRFKIAALAFDDPYALTHRDESTSDEERLITLGSISWGTVPFVFTPYENRMRKKSSALFRSRRDAA